MSDGFRPLVRALTAVLAWAMVTATLVGLGSPDVQAKVPKPAARYTAAIEPLAAYVGQATCSPAAKPGTTAFANLLLRTYPRSRSLGISRSCGVGGKSEHKEGRAFDWGVSVNSAADRKAVNDLMRWLLQRDAYGNRYAMARRLGIQYMIWNRRIWGAYAAGSGWRAYTGSNPHTDHVHFSLSWAGARKKTSFWNPRSFPNSSGSAPSGPSRPAPAPDRPSQEQPADRHDWPDPRPDERARMPRSQPEPRPARTLAQAAPLQVERLQVATRRKGGTTTRKALVAGRRYLIEVSGTYRYGRDPGSLADAECSTRAGASWWQRERSLRSDEWYADHLDLYVDGRDLFAEADGSQSCDDRGHTYRWVYEPTRTGRVPFAVWDPTGYRDNRGRLVVRILDLDHRPDTMTWKVPARQRAGTTSPGLVRGGERYQVTVAGTWKNGRGVTSDAECSLGRDGSWSRDGDSYDMVVGDWGHESLSPRLRGVRSEPASGANDCDPGHGYTFVYEPDRTTPLNVRVQDPTGHADNTGALRVTVKPYTAPVPQPGPQPAPQPGLQPTPSPTPAPLPLPEEPAAPERLGVDSRSSEATTTAQEYPAGTRLRVTATGTYFMREARDWVVADAECTITGWDRRWRTTRFEGLFGGRTVPLGDLAVNGAIVEWRTGGRSSCDWEGHRYTYDLTTSEAGPLRFVVVDDDYGDNRGVLEVEVTAR